MQYLFQGKRLPKTCPVWEYFLFITHHIWRISTIPEVSGMAVKP